MTDDQVERVPVALSDPSRALRTINIPATTKATIVPDIADTMTLPIARWPRSADKTVMAAAIVITIGQYPLLARFPG
jgi:hypothetical protein